MREGGCVAGSQGRKEGLGRERDAVVRKEKIRKEKEKEGKQERREEEGRCVNKIK